VSALHAHLVFATKYRRRVFTDTMLTFCENTTRAVCGDLDVELVELNGEADHVHLLVS
jgi:putative transposase